MRVLQYANDFETKERGQNKRFSDTGVTRGYSEDEFKDMLATENEDIESKFGEEFKNAVKIVYKRNCRNPNKENVIFEAVPEIFKYLVKRQKISLDLSIVHIEEVIEVTQCYNCHGFGHIKTQYTHKRTCQHCRGQYACADCKAERQNCLNCRGATIHYENRNHSARDKRCLIIVRKTNLICRNTNYQEAERVHNQHIEQ